mmetsp:Transcript_45139/g.81642  ORF Transcript_45139/g.81642 Transcript_45139/m.81642 type:complete len:208 (+) Transcript_45139:333-956(+)
MASHHRRARHQAIQRRNHYRSLPFLRRLDRRRLASLLPPCFLLKASRLPDRPVANHLRHRSLNPSAAGLLVSGGAEPRRIPPRNNLILRSPSPSLGTGLSVALVWGRACYWCCGRVVNLAALRRISPERLLRASQSARANLEPHAQLPLQFVSAGQPGSSAPSSQACRCESCRNLLRDFHADTERQQLAHPSHVSPGNPWLKVARHS